MFVYSIIHRFYVRVMIDNMLIGNFSVVQVIGSVYYLAGIKV